MDGCHACQAGFGSGYQIAGPRETEEDLARKYQESRFISWTRFDQADQMIYLMHFEKEQLVRCELLFNKKGQLEGFSLAALKENAKDQQTEKK